MVFFKTGFKVRHVGMYIDNGEYQGVYVNVEQPDKQFLKNRGLYSNNETWLYKAGDISTVKLKVGDGDSPTSGILCYSPFVAEAKGKTKDAVSQCTAPESDEAMAAELKSLIDMKAMLTQAAVEAFVMNPDALFSHGKNFYYIDYLSNGKRLYFPWDYDASFVSNKPGASIYGMKKGNRLSQTAYQQLIINNPEFRSQYNTIMAGLLNGPLQIDTQIAFLNDLEVQLTSALEADDNNNMADSVAERFDALRQWLGRRVISINEQLGN